MILPKLNTDISLFRSGRVIHKRSRKLQRSRHDSRAGAYELAHSKSFLAMLVGSRIVVPKDRLLAWVDRKVSERI